MPSVRVVVQARMSSNRLPGKSLLPIGGIPAAILAALRVRNPRWHVVIATSDHPSDDPLVRAAEAFSVPSVRGLLDDVLGRFLIATHGLADDGDRAPTGDNVLPDARLVGEAVDAFRQRGCAYLYMVAGARCAVRPQRGSVPSVCFAASGGSHCLKRTGST